MTTYKVGYFVGSLSSASINRVLSKALVRLAPEGLEMREVPYGNLPLYNRDYDADYPPVAREFKAAISAVDAVLFVTPGVQPFHSGCAQERHRLGQPAVRHERAHPEAVGHHRNIAGEDRDRRGAAAPAKHPELLQLPADELGRGVHPVRSRIDLRRRRGHECHARRVPAQLHDGVPRVHRARVHGAAKKRLIVSFQHRVQLGAPWRSEHGRITNSWGRECRAETDGVRAERRAPNPTRRHSGHRRRTACLATPGVLPTVTLGRAAHRSNTRASPGRVLPAVRRPSPGHNACCVPVWASVGSSAALPEGEGLHRQGPRRAGCKHRMAQPSLSRRSRAGAETPVAETRFGPGACLHTRHGPGNTGGSAPADVLGRDCTKRRPGIPSGVSPMPLRMGRPRKARTTPRNRRGSTARFAFVPRAGRSAVPPNAWSPHKTSSSFRS